MSLKSPLLCPATSYGRGLPAKCECGLELPIHTSKTKDNPGRPFFRLPTFKDDHLFKWVEDYVYEEVVEALLVLGEVESELGFAKSKNEEVKVVVEELKEELS